MRKLLAKSEDKGLLWLEEHTLHVIQAIECFARAFSMDISLARQGAMLHDLGKGHPTFQAMLIFKSRDKREYWLSRLAGATAIKQQIIARENERAPLHRHELSSLGFLPLFPKSQWPILVEMVVAHHKSIIKDKSSRGLLDLLRETHPEEVIETHFSYWDDWSPAAIEVAVHFGVPNRAITQTEAVEAFQFTIDYVRSMEDGWSPERGLLMAADHFGSAFQHATEERTRSLFIPPDFSIFGKRARSEKAHLYPLSQIPVDDERPHTLVIAPTGAGKTDFLVRRCRGRFFYTLPFQASINAMFRRLAEDLPGADVRRLHAASKVALDTQDEEQDMDENIDLQQHPGATVKVMTPHQLSALVFGTPGHEAIALDIRGRDVILDEIHTFSEASQRMVIQIIRALIGHGCRIHIGTATLPGKLADHLVELLGGASMVYQVSLKPEQLDRFDRHIIHKTYQQEEIGEEQAFQILRQAVSEKEKVLLVANRVATAQAWYWKIKKDPELSRYPLVLIHSRYRRQDRSQLEREIVAVQKPDFDGPAIAVSTQVVEVSLDISFDRMITQAAPLDALIQRFGRVNRRRSDETIGKYKPIHVMSVPEKERDVRPYYLETVRRSYDVLPDGDLLKERDVQRLINRVFPDLLIPEPHYAYIIGAEGTYRIRKLQHQPRSTIVEVLQIEGATCVLNREIEAYRKAPFDKKPLFEIPVPENFNRWNRLPIEPTGSYPFILPEERYQFTEDDKRGLIRDEDVPVHLQIN